jgi:hypothetical protein
MIRLPLTLIATLVVGASIVIGCGGGETAGRPPLQAPTSVSRPTVPATQPTALAARPTTTSPVAAGPTPGGLDKAIANAQADLARRLGVTVQSIQVTSAGAKQWPDTSLGCPEPGMMYSQVVTSGYQVTLVVGGKSYPYHGDGSGAMKLCELSNPTPTVTRAPSADAGSGPTAQPGRLADQVAAARADLRNRVTTLKDENIRLLSAEEVTWNDGSLGCPEPGMMYTMALVPGYRIVLEADGQTYNYHGAKDRPPRLCQPRTRDIDPGMIGRPTPTDPTK